MRTVNILIVFITVFIAAWFASINGCKTTPFYGDSLGYYSYLPSAFIHNNFDSIEKPLTDTSISQVVKDYFHDIEYSFPRTPNGKVMVQYTYGVSFFYAPFFGGVYAYEKFILKSKPTGYSSSFELAIRLGNIFYVLLGLFFSYSVLKTKFGSSFSLLTLSLGLLATNLFWFTVHQSGMSHSIQFFLVALLIWLTEKFYSKPSLSVWILLSFVVGFIILVRPSDILFVFIPLLYGISTFDDISQRVLFFLSKPIWLGLGLLVLVLPFVPQCIFWFKYAGSLFYYSYGSQGFHFLKPHVLKGMFSAENGWLTYSPIFIMALLALLVYKKQNKFYIVAITLVPIYVYVTYCWFNTQYINGFGSRPMIHLYPLLYVFLAWLMVAIFKSRHWVLKIFVAAACLFAVFSNLWLSHKQANDMLWSENTNRKFLNTTFFKSTLNYNDLIVFDNEQQQPISLPKTVVQQWVWNDSTHTVAEGDEFPAPGIFVKAQQLAGVGGWLRLSGIFNCIYPVPDLYQNHMLILQVVKNNKNIVWRGVKINNKVGVDKSLHPKTSLKLHNCNTNIWDEIHFYLKLPKNIPSDADVKLSLWNIGKKPLLVKQLKLELVQ